MRNGKQGERSELRSAANFEQSDILMRKELTGILLFFLVVFTLFSLFSFDPADPFFRHPGIHEHAGNFFGFTGATVSGYFISLFGVGAYWIPVFFLISSIHFFSAKSFISIATTIFGGVVLAVTTGSLISFQHHYVPVWGNFFAPGGQIGLLFYKALTAYANTSGALVILLLLWVIGLMLTTGFSIIGMAAKLQQVLTVMTARKTPATPINVASTENSRKTKTIKREKVAPEKSDTAPPRTMPQPPIVCEPLPKTVATPPATRVQPRNDNGFTLPPTDFLDEPQTDVSQFDNDHLQDQARLLEKTLDDFGVKGAVTAITPGPVITTFEYEPAPGVKINKIVNLSDDLALALKAISIRIVAPIPGKSVIGIEIPNINRQLVRFKEIVVSPAFEKSKSCLTLCMGKDIVGNPVVTELDKMPHLLIAGATGTGKSVGLNAMICSLLYKSTPDQVKLIMIDPKRIELSLYDGISHLITPVVTDVKKATNALFWAVREMERRYELLSTFKVRNITQFNQKAEKAKPGQDGVKPEKLPLIVIIIDELADLMMVASRDVEVALTRLAQMARASGIHLILATQRPSVDVLTGIIKANFPTRLSFQVSSRTDSRTIIDSNGAESLLGNGDMLLLPPGTAKLQRIHGAYISEEELTRIIEFLKAQKPPEYDTAVTETQASEDSGESSGEEHDARYDDAVALVTRTRQASISSVQRHLRIGYNRAARIIEMMEKEGIIGPSDGVKPREVLVRGYDDE